ncbi:MAG: EAL domain-containing protein [Rhodoferax sp.]|nr:MAG: EAL domain-containing protein [Rhodoferax sp.]
MRLPKHYQIVAVGLVPAVLSLCLLVLVARSTLQSWVLERRSNDHEAFVESLVTDIESRIEKSSNALRTAALSSDFADLPERKHIDLAINGIPQELEPRKRATMEFLRTQAHFSVVFVLTPEGDHYISHPFDVQRNLQQYNLASRPYFQKANETRSLVLSDRFVGADGRAAVVIDIPVLDAKGAIKLHLGGVLHLDQLSALVTPDRIAPFDKALLVDANGFALADSDAQAMQPVLDEPYRSALAARTVPSSVSAEAAGPNRVERRIFTDTQGARWLVFETRTAQGWPLYLFRNEVLLLQEIEPAMVRLSVTATLTLLLPSLLGLWMALRYSRRSHRADKALADANRLLEQRVADRTAALNRSELRHRTLFESAVDAVLIMESTRIIDCNPAAVKLFGACDASELIGLQPSSLSPADQPDGESSTAKAAALQEQLSTAADGHICLQWTHSRLHGGGNFVADVHLNRMLLNGTPTIQANVRDISEQLRAQETLRIAATVFESHEGMTVTDASNTILRVNSAFSRITGYSAQEAVGKKPSLLQSGRHAPDFYRRMHQALQTEGAWQGEIWNRRKNGEIYPEWLTISAVKNTAGSITHYVAIFIDISSRKAAENQIQQLAFYDSLTQLANRRLLQDRLNLAISSSSRHTKHNALLYIDLDNFKAINDTLGHSIGDQLLEQVASRLRRCMREGDTVARLGGDEFVVMLEDLSSKVLEAANQAELTAEKIRSAIEQPVVLDSGTLNCTASIGVTLFGSTFRIKPEDPLVRAELAMFHSKDSGRNAVRFFDPSIQEAVNARVTLEAALRVALQEQQLLLYYQPQVDRHGRLQGVEALVRWKHPTRGMVSPAEFIPLAEETGLILPIGKWVLEYACTQLAQWSTQASTRDLSIAVNVSARQFHHIDFDQMVLQVLQDTGANPQRLKLELTESMLAKDLDDVIAKMSRLKAWGVSFSLDDFGTGYSSLSYLKRLPLDQLKIDQGFVRNIQTDSNDAAIAKMVVALADSLNLAVIAEGVETSGQRDFLAALGCYAYQGYLFGKPMPVDALQAQWHLVGHPT